MAIPYLQRKTDVDVPIFEGYLGNLETRKQNLWGKIRSWISHCEAEHIHCRRQINVAVEQEPFCPTRLIDIRSCPAQLVGKDEINVGTVKYAPLSYCWGKTMPESAKTKRTTVSLKDLKENKLPKTFRDAIEIGRKLNIPFLWIDSLCIIQDSTEDWEREAGLMGKVYRNGVLTIAAGVSDHCDGGCLQNPKPVASLAGMGGWTTSFLNDNPLQNRGWILQERELSPRMLYLTPSQALWECRKSRACEWDSGHDNLYVRWGDRLYKRCFDETPLNFEAAVANTDMAYKSWNDTVDDFCTRSFTKIEDRLPALAGLAEQFQPWIQDTYMAGMWQLSLPRSLLWAVKGHLPIKRVQVLGYYHPTWSWISVLGDINHPCDDISPNTPEGWMSTLNARVLEVVLIPKSSSPYGQLKSGFLRIRGRLKRFSRRERFFPLHLPKDDNLPPSESMLSRYDFQAPPAWDKNIFVISIMLAKRGCKGLLLATTNEGESYERIGIVHNVPASWLQDVEEKDVIII